MGINSPGFDESTEPKYHVHSYLQCQRHVCALPLVSPLAKERKACVAE